MPASHQPEAATISTYVAQIQRYAAEYATLIPWASWLQDLFRLCNPYGLRCSREHSSHFMDEEIEAWILEKYSQPRGTGICVPDASS